MSGVWEIEAVRYATVPATKSQWLYDFQSYAEPDSAQALDYWFYVLRDGEQTIVIDTGFACDDGVERGRTVHLDPTDVLAELKVDLLVLTHLHYDHIGNLEAVGDATIALSSAELEFWRSPDAQHQLIRQHTYPHGLARLDEVDRKGRVRPFGKTCRLAPGLTAITVGGHSPGQAVLLVRGADGILLLCSDAVHLYEELECRRPFAIFTDLVGMYAGYDLIDALAGVTGATVVPGHDPLVAVRFPASEGRPNIFRLSMTAVPLDAAHPTTYSGAGR